MSYNRPPCLLRDWEQQRLTDKSPYLQALEERQAKAKVAQPAVPSASVTKIRRREAGKSYGP